MADYRRFTQTDWDAFAGAERFTDKKDPFIWEYSPKDNEGHVEVEVICDRNGIEIYILGDDPDDEEPLVYAKVLHKSSTQMEGELRQIIKEISQYTYAPDLAYVLDHTYDSKEPLGGFH